ncbi:hypothetical protein [Phytohabitans rumicis]|uniref:Uncharacterized protein n=1 Tax=Phytohabitans rumicis TaxID=1076125 RepID=A0A6V8L388_9ACTN|nr:hypothetical protein [Phytohabitans rumicis]GFJ91733.1 hypothetical protein Prum_053750 [Phytohabitans rumicis]
MSTEADESSPERSFVEGLGLRIQRDERPEPGPAPHGVARIFRLPRSHDPAPPATRLIVMCAWATALGVAGLGVATRGLMAIMGGLVPGWYEPSFVAVGLAGIGLTVGAFMSIHHRRLPWVLLALAIVPLAGSVALTIQAT